jgi:hypothetical protein
MLDGCPALDGVKLGFLDTQQTQRLIAFAHGIRDDGVFPGVKDEKASLCGKN